MSSINPKDWSKPSGYSNGVLLTGTRVLCIAGQVAWDQNKRLVGGSDFVAQFRQALSNVRAVVEAAGGKVGHIGKLTIYVTDKKQYLGSLKQTGAAYRDIFGTHYPAMALVEVKGLVEDGALIEIEALAVLP